MLTESEIIEAVCRHLRQEGWKIVSTCTEKQRGDDIVAEHPKTRQRLVVEAKGETSSMSHTNRYGKSFDSRQVRSHVARAFLTAATHFGNEDLVAIALPLNDLHAKCVNNIIGALRKLSIEVFWVAGDGRVATQGIWSNAS